MTRMLIVWTAGIVAVGVAVFCLAYMVVEMVVDTVNWVMGNG